MAHIEPQLNLNRTPQIVKNTSLVFAKNIKVLKDGSIANDDGIIKVSCLETYTKDYNIVGVIPYNTVLFILLYNATTQISKVLKYTESSDELEEIKCNWNYSGGTINGNVTVNLNSDIILTIAEFDAKDSSGNTVDVPIKFININQCSLADDESIYTQSPRIPILNLLYKEKYCRTIPNGVYQFFVRFEIKKDFYTNWFPCSMELFSGNKHLKDTIQGSVQYVDITSDSTESFVFSVQQLFDNPGYKSFQIGFILSHDDETVARSWKSFSFDVDTIYFDYDKEYIKEVDIEEMLTDAYQLYNVKNLTNFKNKLYISNYKETDFNPDLTKLYYNVSVGIGKRKIPVGDAYYYNSYPLTIKSIANTNVAIETDSDKLPEAYYNDEIIFNTPTFVKETSYKVERSYLCKTEEECEDYVAEYFQDGNAYVIWLTEIVLTYEDSTTESVQLQISIKQNDTFGNYIISAQNNTLDFSKDLSVIYHAFTDQIVRNEIDGFSITNGNLIYNNKEVKNVKVNYDCIGAVNMTPVTDSDGDYTGFYVQRHYSKCSVTYNELVDITPIIKKTDEVEANSLLPFKTYEFYIHYVDKYGHITNGYFVDRLTINYDPGYIQYPIFEDMNYSDEYPCCFFSICDVGNNIAQIFNSQYDSETKKVTGDCLEIDSLIFPISGKIKLYDTDEITEDIDYFGKYTLADFNSVEARYKYSGDADSETGELQFFGASGKVVYTYGDGRETMFFIMQNDKNQDYKQLVKCTPYIKDTAYENSTNCNLLGYVCKVYKPTYDEFTRFISGSDVYNKEVGDNNKSINLTLDEGPIDVNSTVQNIIYSEYNLNYLSLVTDVSSRVRTTKETTTETDGSTTTNKYKQILASFESLTLSDVYELKSMYKAFQRKYYNTIDDDVITQFNNTIRASNVISEEGRTYIYTFKADKYYNVPTGKGYITNLKAIADKILVHTQDSLFSFTGSTKLSTENGNTQLDESDPFDTGISETFGSEHGFVGLSDNRYSMICYEGYMFFDKDAKVVYDYTGQQLMTVSDPIEQLMSYKTITDILFADDFYNDRFFMLVKFDDDTKTNLSFNYKQKSFVSLHDFDFDKSFTSKVRCYFLKDNGLYYISKDSNNYSGLYFEDNLYPHIGNTYDTCKSIVDIIYNESYERVKTLNSISWIGNTLSSFATLFDATDNNSIRIAEEIQSDKQCFENIRLYSENCMTSLLDCSKNASDISITDLTNNYPVYNDGLWSMNMFRNILNQVDKYIKYKDVSTYISGDSEDNNGYLIRHGSKVINPKFISNDDNKSLVYGKYFVLRGILKQGFKLENIIFNIQ